MKKLLISALAGVATFALAPSATAQAGEEFIGQLKSFGFNFCPRGWHAADGSLLRIAQYSALYSLYGTSFGGDGRNTFGLPNLNARMAMGRGAGPGLSPRTVGEMLGSSTTTLMVTNLPEHNHRFMASADPQAQNTPEGGSFPTYPASVEAYSVQGSSDVVMSAQTITPAGGTQPLSIQQPVLAVTWCVSLSGIFPQRP